MVIRHRNRSGVEGVGFQNISARGQISVVNLTDDVGTRQNQQIVIALQVALPVGKTCTAKILF